jgi:flagellar hook-associated protein 1 FlgK
MSLSIGLDVASSALGVSAEQTAVLSRNVARAGDAHASRKTANVVTALNGGVRVASITRQQDQALFDKMIAASTDASAQKAIVDALNALDLTGGDTESDATPAAQLAKFASAMQQYAQEPQNDLTARAAVAAANDLATTLNSATQTVQQVRAQADADIASSVSQLNDLLSQFEAVNDRIKQGTQSGADVTDDLDKRDQLLTSISGQIGIRTVTRANNDMAIYTDNGLTLFDTHPRAVTFDATSTFLPSTTGSSVFVDGVAVTGNTGLTGSVSGRIAALANVRDTIAVTYQSQLDEIARGLVQTFAESDQSASPSLPDVPGLFTWSGAPAMPASGSIQVGIAGTIKVNANVDPAQGGDPSLLRDGAISDPGNSAYVYNTTGASGFSDRLNQLLDRLDQQRSFDPAAGTGPTGTLSDYASASVAWLQGARKSASDDADYKGTLLDRSSQALSSATGVNLDEEMTLMLDLERSYQASSKLITTIDNMYGALLAAVGSG